MYQRNVKAVAVYIYIHCPKSIMILSCTVLYPQGAMGFPGMLGQKVSNTFKKDKVVEKFICYPELLLQTFDQTNVGLM